MIPPTAAPSRAPRAPAERPVTPAASPAQRAPIAMPAPVVTIALVVGLGAIFAVEMVWGNASTPTLAHMGANIVARTRAGEVDRLLAASTLHVAPWHAMMNLYVLWALGRQLEPLFGRTRFTVLYFASAVGGGIGTTLVGGLFGGAGASAGASGAIWGLLGASAVLAFRPPPGWPPQVIAAARRGALMNLAINVGISFMPGIDRWAHFGGGLVGAILVGLGILVPPRWAQARGEQEGTLHDVALKVVAFSLLAATVASVGVAWARGRPWELMQPPELVSRRMTTADLSMSLPAELEEVTPVTFGDLTYDRYAMQILGSDVRSGMSASSEAALQLQQMVPDDAAPVGPPRQLTLASGAVALQSYRVGDELTLVRVVVAGERKSVAFDLVGWRAYGEIEPLAERVADSVRF